MTATQLIAPTTPGGAAFAPAFAAEAALRDLELGPALKAEVRSGAAGTAHVLTVRNTTGEPQEFRPEALLPQGEGPLLFLGGASTTEQIDGGLVARLAPHGFVRLGRILERPQEHA
ncbi:hypothetical protein [Streptomyces sp. NPDC090036]|uniref:hypothetical protein n=1 Tax=Streptomyces sp. NPDC090036 TaxID=3365926 RepID=UPI00380F2048